MTPYGDPYGQSGYPEPYPAAGALPAAGLSAAASARLSAAGLSAAAGYPLPPVPGDYRASGTEPFWDLTIGRELIFTDRGTGLTIVQPTPRRSAASPATIYRTQRLEVNITHQPCNDGMSDRSYPDTVQVYADGRLYRGCGGAAAGDPLAPAPPGAAPMAAAAGRRQGRRRRSTARAGWCWRSTAARCRATSNIAMEFDAGKLSAKFGCNSIGAGYTQTGLDDRRRARSSPPGWPAAT